MLTSPPEIPGGQHGASVAAVADTKRADARCIAQPEARPICGRSRSPGEAGSRPEGKALCLRSLLQEASPGKPDKARLLQWIGQSLAVNVFEDPPCSLESLVPRPKKPLLRQDLVEDEWLAVDCKKPEYLEEFNALLEERRRVEGRHEEFCFVPLKTTLRNWCRLIDHIRAGHQFEGALTLQEDLALAWAGERAAALHEAGAPYKRTVCLSVACLTLVEIITDRLVLRPLLDDLPKGSRRQCIRRLELGAWPGAQLKAGEHPVATCSEVLDPAMVAALCWGGNNPDGACETDELFTQQAQDRLWFTLLRLVDDDTRLIYPSFQPLDIVDFGQFGHLPLHPVGLTTEHALGADGLMRSPLEFAVHDLTHMGQLRTVGAPQYQAVIQGPAAWHRCDRRLAWRCLLRDRMPACLAPLNLGPALDLLLFQMFHELEPEDFPKQLQAPGEKGFFYCLRRLAEVRRNQREAYTASDLAITDREAAVASLWAACLFTAWKREQFGPLTDEALAACAQRFVDHGVPRLDQHLDFISHNRAALRYLFASPPHCSVSITGEDRAVWRWEADVHSRQAIVLFDSRHDNGGPGFLDYTDVAYFVVRRFPGLSRKMADSFDPPPPRGSLAPLQWL